MKSLLLDQGCPWSAASLLNLKGWDVIHVRDVELSRSSDIEILEWARKNNRTCVTLDADFHMILALQGAETPSTIRIRIEGLRGPDLADLLSSEWPKMEKHLELGAMVTITEKNIRSRPLPIR